MCVVLIQKHQYGYHFVPGLRLGSAYETLYGNGPYFVHRHCYGNIFPMELVHRYHWYGNCCLKTSHSPSHAIGADVDDETMVDEDGDAYRW